MNPPAPSEEKPRKETFYEHLVRYINITDGSVCMACEMGAAGPGKEGEHDPDCFMIEARDAYATNQATIAELQAKLDAEQEQGSYSREIQRCLGFIPGKFIGNDEWENSVKRMADELPRNQATINKLEQDYADLAIEMSFHCEEISKQKATINNLKDELEGTRVMYREAWGNIYKLQATINSLRTRIEELIVVIRAKTICFCEDREGTQRKYVCVKHQEIDKSCALLTTTKGEGV